MTPLRLTLLALAAAGALIAVMPAAHAFPMECLVKGAPDRTVEVGEGDEMRTLHGGETVFGALLAGDFYLTVERGQHLQFEQAVNPDDLDCIGAGDREYPIVITSDDDLVALGLDADFLDNPEKPGLEREPRKCFDGIAPIRFAVSRELASAYESRGVSLRNLCVVMQSGQLRFDPETGERLPTFVLVSHDYEGNWISTFEFPLLVPRCFGRGTPHIVPEELFADLFPIGCKVRYHPWSGRPLSPEEQKKYGKLAFLYIDGRAGGSVLDADSLAADATRRATAAKIQALKALIAK